jgi:hypothetical protein
VCASENNIVTKEPAPTEVSSSHVTVSNRSVSSELPLWLQKQLDRTIAKHLEKGKIMLAHELNSGSIVRLCLI